MSNFILAAYMHLCGTLKHNLSSLSRLYFITNAKNYDFSQTTQIIVI